MRELYFPPLQSKDAYEKKFNEHIASIRDSDLTRTEKLALFQHGIRLLRNLRANKKLIKSSSRAPAAPATDETIAASHPPGAAPAINNTFDATPPPATPEIWSNYEAVTPPHTPKTSKKKVKKKKANKPPVNWQSIDGPRKRKPNQRYTGKLWT